MYLLILSQADTTQNIGLFETKEEGFEFVEKIPGYEKTVEEGFEYETIDPGMLKEYEEIEYKGNLVPISKFSFQDEEEIYVDWFEIPILSNEGEGLVEGITLVDAYHVDNEELREYIEKREEKYSQVKSMLEEKGYEVDRDFAGSEDGEAIVYKEKDKDEWHFLVHMDPFFVEENIDENWISEIIE